MSLNIEVTTDLAKATSDIDNFSKRSRIALTQLSLVAQDLPYGFIGIQNNLPFLVKSFQDLTTDSKGVTGALKALGTELIGPAGLFFAFSAVTAVITSLIQKYGSLSGALDALTGSITPLQTKFINAKKSYDEFIKSIKSNNEIIGNSTATVQANIIKVNALSEALKSNTTSQLDKKKALQELKGISDEYFGSLNAKGLDLKKLTDLTDQYTQSIINQAIARGYEDEIVAITKEKAKQERILLDIVSQLPNEYAKIKKAAKDALNVGDAEAYNLAISAIPIGQQKDIDKVNQKYFEQANRVTDLTKKFEYFKKLLSDITLQNLKFTPLDPEKVKKAAIEIDRYYTRYKPISLLDEKRVKNLAKLQDELQLANKTLRGKPAPGIKEVISPDIFKKQKEYQDFLKQLLRDTESTANLLSQVFLDPLTNAFKSFLDTGKLTFKEFGKVVLENLKQLAAKIAATGIIALLATLATGGFGAAAGTASGTSGFLAGLKTFGTTFGSLLGFKNVAAPTFGGVGPGGLAMSGAVSLSLRGSDLVGALNRTNTNINRIG